MGGIGLRLIVHALYDIFYTIMVHHQELSYYVMINIPPYVAMYKDVKCNM